MSPEEYQQRLTDLGVNRGALSTGFASIFTATGSQEATYLTGKAKGEIVKPPMEDLSHLNHHCHAKSQITGAIRYPKAKPHRNGGYRRRKTEIGMPARRRMLEV